MKTTHLLVGLCLSMMTTSCLIVVGNDCTTRAKKEKKQKKVKADPQQRIDEVVSLAPLKSLNVSLGIDVVYEQKDTIPTAYIVGHLAAGSKLVYEGATNGALSLKIKHNGNVRNEEVKVRIVAPTLTTVSLSTGSAFKAQTLQAPSFSADISTGSTLHIGSLAVEQQADLTATTGATCNVRTLRAHGNVGVTSTTGASSRIAELSGATLSAQATTGSDIDIHKLDVQHVVANATTGSNIKLTGSTKTTRIAEDCVTGGVINLKNLRIAQ